MTSFIVEIYAPAREAACHAACALSRGTEVRHMRSILVPEDETCFHLVESASADAVAAAVAAAAIRFERIVEAIDIGAGGSAPREELA